MTILLIQIEAIIGAWLFSFLSGKIGNRNTLLIGIGIWVFVCLIGYFIDKNHPQVEMQFYTMAALVGLVMCGFQPLVRSIYTLLLYAIEDNIFNFYIYEFVVQV